MTDKLATIWSRCLDWHRERMNWQGGTNLHYRNSSRIDYNVLCCHFGNIYVTICAWVTIKRADYSLARIMRLAKWAEARYAPDPDQQQPDVLPKYWVEHCYAPYRQEHTAKGIWLTAPDDYTGIAAVEFYCSEFTKEQQYRGHYFPGRHD